MKTIKTSEIPGPPYACPECANEGKRFNTNSRPGMGSHRLGVHGVKGVSTGSNAYRQSHNYTKVGSKWKKTSIKRTPSKRTYTKKYAEGPTTNPIVEFLANPAAFAANLDALIYEKQAEAEKLQSQIQELAKEIRFYERFRSLATEAQAEPTTRTETHFHVA